MTGIPTAIAAIAPAVVAPATIPFFRDSSRTSERVLLMAERVDTARPHRNTRCGCARGPLDGWDYGCAPLHFLMGADTSQVASRSMSADESLSSKRGIWPLRAGSSAFSRYVA